MKYYEFTQNNSGGSVVYDAQLTHRLFIEARSETKATEKAIRMGVYFEGTEDETDCSCCGDRWSKPDEMEFPYRYGTFDKDKAEEMAEKYGADFGKTEFKFLGTHEPDPDKYDVVFRNVESYAQYLADRYSMLKEGTPDARIFKDDGTVVDIIPNRA